jgi:pre-rRNA-processing protein TSR1
MLRFGQVNQSCMATVFGPILFPPASVIAFKTCKSELIPVGSGHLFSVDPNRLVIKRVLLSGHPFKVTNKNAVVRFMFFNREDIEWFKPVELRTRYGRRGHIKEPLGKIL